jgi:hypothetical protein
MIDGTIVKVHRHGQGAKGGLVIRQLANQTPISTTSPKKIRLHNLALYTI